MSISLDVIQNRRCIIVECVDWTVRLREILVLCIHYEERYTSIILCGIQPLIIGQLSCFNRKKTQHLGQISPTEFDLQTQNNVQLHAIETKWHKDGLRYLLRAGECLFSKLAPASALLSLIKGLYLMHRNQFMEPTLRAGTWSHLVGLSHVKLVQGAPYGSLTGVNHEFTHLPAPYWGVQVHVIHPTADLANLIPWQFVDDKPAVKRGRFYIYFICKWFKT